MSLGVADLREGTSAIAAGSAILKQQHTCITESERPLDPNPAEQRTVELGWRRGVTKDRVPVRASTGQALEMDARSVVANELSPLKPLWIADEEPFGVVGRPDPELTRYVITRQVRSPPPERWNLENSDTMPPMMSPNTAYTAATIFAQESGPMCLITIYVAPVFRVSV
jgi:hypothetical protein